MPLSPEHPHHEQGDSRADQTKADRVAFSIFKVGFEVAVELHYAKTQQHNAQLQHENG